MNRNKKEMNKKVSASNNGAGKAGQQKSTPNQTKGDRKPKGRSPKTKTPAGHIRYTDGKTYMLQSINVRCSIYCKDCRTDNARVIGYIVVGSKIYYVAKCPWHPQNLQFVEENELQEKYPNIFPGKQQVTSSNPYNPDWPVQRSYCNRCKATTAEIIGRVETEYGPKWTVRCTEPDCGCTWNEDVDGFARKYIGTDKNPPLYRQTPRKEPSNWNDPDSSSPLEVLKAVKVSPRKKEETVEPVSTRPSSNTLPDTNGKLTDEPLENKQPSETLPCEPAKEPADTFLNIQGISFKLPANMKATVELVNGKPVISFN